MKKCSFSLGLWNVIALVFLGCSSQVYQPSESLSGKNVILISVDTLRADHVQPYGALSKKPESIQTPNIQMLADDGVVFWNAVTPVPLTVPAHATLMTGLHPIRHGVRDNFSSILSDSAVTLAELFHESGYETAGVIGAILLSRRNGFQQGFDRFDDEFTEDEFQAVQPTVERKADRVFVLAQSWLDSYLDSERKVPFFLFLHFYDPHMLYQPPEPFHSQFKKDPYAGEVAFADSVLGQFFSLLKERGLYEDTAIVLVGDHGEGLGDHDEKTHGLFLYEECIRIPMIFKLPNGCGAVQGKTVQQTAALQDVLPTLSELMDLTPSDCDGMSLVPWLFGREAAEERWTLHETQYPLTYNWSPLYAWRNQTWKYIQAPKPELYRLESDPKESQNVLSRESVRGADMERELELQKDILTEMRPFAPVEQISSQQSEVLASLGYTAGSGSNAREDVAALPDPKDKIAMYNLIDIGLGQLARHNYQQAIDSFQQAMQEDENNPTPYFNLGLTYMQLRDWSKSIEFTEKALERNPGHVMIHLQLARVLRMNREFDRSRAILETIVESQPQLADAHYQLGLLAYEEKQYDEALRHFRDAKRWMPDMPGLDDSIRQVTKTQR